MYTLITGGAGFIGSNLIVYLLQKYEDIKIINLDKLTYAGDLNNLKEVNNHPNYIFIKGDIQDKNLLQNLFKKYSIHHVFHLAAESHVDNSISSPQAFIDTNIIGTFQLLEVAKKTWLSNEYCLKKEYQNAKFLHISTDEVYGSLGKTGYFTEKTSYAPNSPYSASKASSDMLVRSYFHTYNLPVMITNCSNNFGEKQHNEKLIPTIIRNALAGNPIPIYGTGDNVRDWLYVMDHCSALDTILNEGRLGETYNIGTRNEKNNLQLTNQICEILDNKIISKPNNIKSFTKLISFVKDRAGHDKRYAIDNSKLVKELNWKSEYSFEETLKKTIDFYIQKYKIS